MPTNISAATATLLAGPGSLAQDPAGSTDLWFAYTAPAGHTAIGLRVWTDASSSLYFPRVSIFTGTPGSLTSWPTIGPMTNVVFSPLQIPVVAGQTYYVQIHDASAPSGVSLNVSLLSQPILTVPIGSLVIPDDIEGFPGTVISGVDGSVLQLVPMTNGEEGDVLPSGIFAVFNDDTGAPRAIVLYDTSLTQIASTATGAATSVSIRGSHTEFFYVLNTGGTGVVHTLSAAGAIGGTSWSIANAELIAPNRAGTILYYTQRAVTAAPIKQWDLIGNVGLSNLSAGVGGATVTDMLVLADDTILVSWKIDAKTFSIKHYSSGGAVLNTYGYTLPQNIDSGPLLAYGVDDPASFWVWASYATSVGTFQSKFQHITVADGSVITTLTPYVFEAGVGPGEPLASMPRFGQSKSCPFMVARAPITSTVPAPPSGGSIPPTNPPPGGDCHCPPPPTPKSNTPGPLGGGDGNKSGISTGGTPAVPIAGNDSPCAQGGQPASYATVTVPETWAGQREPRIWLDARFQDVSTTPSTTTPVQLALEPIPDLPTDQGGYKAGTLTGITGIRRSLSNESGDYSGAQLSITHNDAARTIRKLLADPTKKYIHGSQFYLKIRSETQRRAHGAPTVLFRGILRGHDMQRRLGATLTIEDYISSEFGPLGSRRVISDRRLTTGLYAGIPPENAGKPQPIILGYVGDRGSVMPGTGEAADKGLVPAITVGSRTINGTQCLELFVAGHACAGVQVYASDPTHTKRIPVPSGDYGSVVYAPGQPGWPFPTLYFDDVDSDTGKTHRVTKVYVDESSEYAKAHLAGQINIAFNVCAMEERGDGTGRVISGLFLQFQHLLDNYILRRPGYYTGLYAGAPQWDDGTYLTQSASFLAAQAITVGWIGGEGYIGSLVINDAPLSRDITKIYAVTGHFNYGWSQMWQCMVSLPDDTASLTGLTTLRPPSQVRAGAAPAYSTDQIENPLQFNYDYDYDKGKWRGTQQEVRDQIAIDREGGERPAVVDCKATNHLPTARDAMARRLLWNKYPRPIVPLDTPIDGLDLELGQLVRVTSYDGLGNGYVNTVVRLRSLDSYDAKTNRMQWTGIDMTDIARNADVFDGATAVFDSATFA